MPTLNNRQETSLKKAVRPTSDKLIFIACEGQKTEENYFAMISDMFDGVKSKIRIISVMEEVLSIPEDKRTPEQKSEVGKSMPWQLVEKIDKFKENEADRYDFQNHLEDEFWIIADVDHHTRPDCIDKWNKTLNDCDSKKYNYAISNPFFEIWLLLHHLDPNEEDYKYAVTEQHAYEKTDHFKKRLRKDARAGLVDGKDINKEHYNIAKVKNAINRAEQLHNKEEKWPYNLGSTVYLLINKIVEIADSVAG